MHRKINIIWCFVFLFMSSFVVSQHSITLVSEVELDIKEPSGIAFHEGDLYVVGDSEPFLYQLSLGGLIKDRYEVAVKDMEGVVYHPKFKSFVLLSETNRQMVRFSIENGIQEKFDLKGKQSKSNMGLEGICYHSDLKSLFVVNEAHPKRMMQVTNKGKVKKKFDLKFPSDISGITYDKELNVFWIVSDESKALYKVSEKGEEIQKFLLDIEKAEGIAIDDKRRLYIVSDRTNNLFVYQIK